MSQNAAVSDSRLASTSPKEGVRPNEIQDSKISIYEELTKKPDIDIKPVLNPLIASLPPYLKDPANFEKVQKSIIETFRSTCSHSDMLEWSNCLKCTKKMLERRALLKKLGFKSAAQYMAWRKVHETIVTRFPLWDFKNNRPIK